MEILWQQSFFFLYNFFLGLKFWTT
jgi:hypothetical protein